MQWQNITPDHPWFPWHFKVWECGFKVLMRQWFIRCIYQVIVARPGHHPAIKLSLEAQPSSMPTWHIHASSINPKQFYWFCFLTRTAALQFVSQFEANGPLRGGIFLLCSLIKEAVTILLWQIAILVRLHLTYIIFVNILDIFPYLSLPIAWLLFVSLPLCTWCTCNKGAIIFYR